MLFMTTPFQHDKLTPISKSCIFIGYTQNLKDYRCYDTSSGKAYVSIPLIQLLSLPYNHPSHWFSHMLLHHHHPFPISPLLNSPHPTLNITPSPDSSSSSTPPATTQLHNSSPSTHHSSPQQSHPISTPPTNVHPIQTHLKSGTFITKTIFTLLHTSLKPYPTSFFVATKFPQCCKAMSAKFQV